MFKSESHYAAAEVRSASPDLAEYGPFAELWADGPGHLYLLGGSSIAFTKIERLVTREPTLEPFLTRMIRDVNWRPQLVASVALLLSTDEPARHLRDLWAKLDAGSWIAPQIGCTLFFVDPDFDSEAERRVLRPPPMRAPAGLTEPERVHAMGPAGGLKRTAKNTVTLLRLLDRIPERSEFVAAAFADPATAELIECEEDGAETIVDGWMQFLESVFESAGRRLVRAAA